MHSLLGHNLSDDEIVIHTLNRLGAEYKELTAAIRARDSSLSFEELYDKLTDYETYLKHEDKAPGPPITAQVSHKSKRKSNQYSKPINNDSGKHRLKGATSITNSLGILLPCLKGATSITNRLGILLSCLQVATSIINSLGDLLLCLNNE
ncbi:hypothetical protein BHM03_00032577 [Ensete ventricosum]|nr:hypothetical protein BHM03_00032577 [Ensete ventricosum]